MAGGRAVKKFTVLLMILTILFSSYALAEDISLVGKVTTPKGSLNMRSGPAENSRIVTAIPNGSCLLITQENDQWLQVRWDGLDGYCKAEFITVLDGADPGILNYSVLSRGDRGEEVTELKSRLQELGYIRDGASLTDSYNDTLTERVKLAQRQSGFPETGIATPEFQAFIYSDRAPFCTETLPKAKRSQVIEPGKMNRKMCGCCMGEGCDCCGMSGWIYY